MTNLATFIGDSAYPGKTLYMDQNQLYIEGVGPVPVARLRELDTVGQLQWESEEMRQLAYSVTRTNLATFTHDSAYPDKVLYLDQNQLYIEGTGAVAVARLRELDTVGQLQWQSEEMRQLAYSLEVPVPQPAQEPQPQPQEPPRSSSSVFGGIIAVVAVLAICVLAYFAFQSLSADDPPDEPPASQSEPEAEPESPPETEPEPEPEPEPPSDETIDQE